MLMFHLLLVAVVELWAGAPAQRPLIGGLVQELGSRRNREREAASAVLRAVGDMAFDTLVKAAETSPDAEIRRRATNLLEPFEARLKEKQVEAIKHSGLGTLEKGRKLSRFLRVGMSADEVHALLGHPGTSSLTSACLWEVYHEYGLSILYGGAKVSSVNLTGSQ
jgi:hypothetical protein